MVNELVFAAGIMAMLAGWILHLYVALKRAADAARLLKVHAPVVAEHVLADREEGGSGWQYLGEVGFLWHDDVLMASLRHEPLHTLVQSARRLISLLPVTASALLVGSIAWHFVCQQSLEPRPEDAKLPCGAVPTLTGVLVEAGGCESSNPFSIACGGIGCGLAGWTSLPSLQDGVLFFLSGAGLV